MSMLHHHHRTVPNSRIPEKRGGNVAPARNRTNRTYAPGDLLAMIATSPAPSPDNDESNGDDLALTDHDIAAQLPPEITGITSEGKMENHRTPIVSIHGKDVDERDHAA